MNFNLNKAFSPKKSMIALAFASAFTATSVQADSCDFDMEYDIDISEQNIKLANKDELLVRISSDNELYLKGQSQQLNAQQEQLLEAYAEEIRRLIPAVNEVATEATELVEEAVGDVSAVLFDEEPKKAEEFAQGIRNITQEIKQHVSANHLRPTAIEAYFEENEFGEEFEALLEEAITEFVQDNVGDIIVAAMSGDTDKVDAFESKMEKFGENMESKFEQKGEALEKRAEALCELVKTIESKEDDFVESFEKYEDYQLVSD